MSARDDLALARRHPAATVVTLLLALVFGATVGGVWGGGSSTVAALLVVALFAGWIAWIAYGPDLLARRKNADEEGAQQ